MQRVILGLVKGLIVGGGIAYGLLRLGWTAPVWSYLACALVGAVVGVVCGRAPWKSETIWTPVVKLIVGGLIGAGLCALGRHVIPAFHVVNIANVGDITTDGGPFLAACVGLIYGIFVEVDDGGKSEKDKPKDDVKLPAPRPRLKG